MKLNHNISFVGSGMVMAGQELSKAQELQLMASGQAVCLAGEKVCKPLAKETKKKAKK